MTDFLTSPKPCSPPHAVARIAIGWLFGIGAVALLVGYGGGRRLGRPRGGPAGRLE